MSAPTAPYDPRYHFRVYHLWIPEQRRSPESRPATRCEVVTTGGRVVHAPTLFAGSPYEAAHAVLREVLELGALPDPRVTETGTRLVNRAVSAWHHTLNAFLIEFVMPHIEAHRDQPEAAFGFYVRRSKIRQWYALHLLAEGRG